jgi:hypothetical protein
VTVALERRGFGRRQKSLRHFALDSAFNPLGRGLPLLIVTPSLLEAEEPFAGRDALVGCPARVVHWSDLRCVCRALLRLSTRDRSRISVHSRSRWPGWGTTPSRMQTQRRSEGFRANHLQVVTLAPHRTPRPNSSATSERSLSRTASSLEPAPGQAVAWLPFLACSTAEPWQAPPGDERAGCLRHVWNRRNSAVNTYTACLEACQVSGMHPASSEVAVRRPDVPGSEMTPRRASRGGIPAATQGLAGARVDAGAARV